MSSLAGKKERDCGDEKEEGGREGDIYSEYGWEKEQGRRGGKKGREDTKQVSIGVYREGIWNLPELFRLNLLRGTLREGGGEII